MLEGGVFDGKVGGRTVEFRRDWALVFWTSRREDSASSESCHWRRRSFETLSKCEDIVAEWAWQGGRLPLNA